MRSEFIGVNGCWMVISSFERQYELFSFVSRVRWDEMKEGEEIKKKTSEVIKNHLYYYGSLPLNLEGEKPVFLAEVRALFPWVSFWHQEVFSFSKHAIAISFEFISFCVVFYLFFILLLSLLFVIQFPQFTFLVKFTNFLFDAPPCNQIQFPFLTPKSIEY